MKISKPEYKSRIETLQRKLSKEGCDHLIVSEEEDIYYLTGLTYKSLERLFLLIIKKNEVKFILPKMELAHLKEVDIAARGFLNKQGLMDNLMHRTGHGIGLGNHEGPYLALGDKTVLKENMVVSIEPGIYIEGVGGFRHSDTVRITKDGYELMTNCDDQIEQLTFTNPKILPKIKGKIIKKMFQINN